MNRRSLLLSRVTRHASRLRFLLAVLAATGLAHAQPSLIDQLFERHVRVKTAVGGGVLHLLYQRKADPQASPASCYRRYAPGQGWLGEETLGGAHRCVAFLDGTLYVFRGDNYSLYRASDWTARFIFHQDDAGAGGESTWETRPWPLPWAPESACRVAGELWVFGVADAPQIVAARIRAGQEPAALGEPLAVQAKASDVNALALGHSATVFWHHDSPDGLSNELWQAAFDGEAWTPPVRVAQPYPRSDCTAAEHEGRVWVFFKKRGERIKTTQRLMAVSGAGNEWSQPTPVPEALDPRLGWTLDIDAASFDGTLYVFRACMNRDVDHRWADGKWLAP